VQPQALTFLRESTKPSHKPRSSSIKGGVLCKNEEKQKVKKNEEKEKPIPSISFDACLSLHKKNSLQPILITPPVPNLCASAGFSWEDTQLE
jgi:hypothetical protein